MHYLSIEIFLWYEQTGDDITEIDEGMSSYYEPPSEPPPPLPAIVEDFAKFSENDLDVPIVTEIDDCKYKFIFSFLDYRLYSIKNRCWTKWNILKITLFYNDYLYENYIRNYMKIIVFAMF